MIKQQIIENIKKKKSFLCIGLDSEINKIPKHLLDADDPVFEFNKAIIDATIDLAVAYKPNIAFYESLGAKGWITLERTIDYLNTFKKEIFTIADAKRGDIGNTSRLYAKTFFETLNFDSVTVAPYMGEDSVSPFLTYPGKWIILLALTSNKGADDFQNIPSKDDVRLFESVLRKASGWGNDENMMFVVGATRAEMLKDIRRVIPNHFLLVPGVGAQGGSLDEVAKYGLTKDCGLLVNASRNIIFASSEKDFAIKAREQALLLQREMCSILEQNKII